MRRSIGALLLAFVVIVGSACANDGADNSTFGGPTTDAPDSTESTDATDATGATDARSDVPPTWEKVIAPSNCQCSDGSDYHFWIRRGTSDRLLFYLEGGGACFTAATCGPATPSYKRSLAKDDPDGPGGSEGTPSGVFDLANDANPFRDDSIVYVPYCTGDLHLGDAVHDYGGGVVIRHNGATNASTALAAAAAVFPQTTSVVVAGGSAGSAPAPVFGGLAHDIFPEADISVIADGSGAYPGTEAITLAISALWGTQSALPRWPETANDPPTAWSLPGTFVQVAKHAPGVRLASINTAYDETQQRFVSLAGFPGDDLLTMIDENIAFSEAGGADIASWVGPGTLHTILTRPQLFDTEVDGSSLLEWVTAFVDGEDVPDVHCGECGKPS